MMKKILIALLPTIFTLLTADAQDMQAEAGQSVSGEQLVRLSKITVDPACLAAYNAYLQEEIEASLRLEPGVLALYAVAEKGCPNRVTILEIYADDAAYRSHIATPHFRKYKQGTLDMVQSLELVDVEPLIPGGSLRQTVAGQYPENH